MWVVVWLIAAKLHSHHPGHFHPYPVSRVGLGTRLTSAARSTYRQMRSEVRRRSVPASGASAGSPQTRTEPEVQLRLLIMKRWWAWPLLSLPPRTLAVGNTPTPSRKARISGSWHLLHSLLAPSLGPAGTPHPLCHGSASARMFMSVRRRHLSRRWRNVGPSSSQDESESESSSKLLMAWEDASCQSFCAPNVWSQNVWYECKLQNSPFLGCTSAKRSGAKR